MLHIQLLAIPLVIFAILDYVWFTFFMKDYAIQQLYPILLVEGDKIQARMGWAVTAYVLMAIISLFFLYPQVVRSETLTEALGYGFLLGICVFGIFDGTNGALMKVYPATFIFIDTLWGGALYTVAAYAYWVFKTTTDQSS